MPYQHRSTGYNPANWTFFPDIAVPLQCDYKPKLLYFSLENNREGTDTYPAYAATSYRGNRIKIRTQGEFAFGQPGLDEIRTPVNMQMAWKNANHEPVLPQVVTAATELQEFLAAPTSGNSTVAFVHYGNTAIGIYAGTQSALGAQSFCVCIAGDSGPSP